MYTKLNIFMNTNNEIYIKLKQQGMRAMLAHMAKQESTKNKYITIYM